MTVVEDSSKFARIQGSIIGKVFLETLEFDLNIHHEITHIFITKPTFLETLEFDLNIQHEIKHIFITKPTFSKYTEVDDIYIKLIKMSIPSEYSWEKLCKLLDWNMGSIFSSKTNIVTKVKGQISNSFQKSTANNISSPNCPIFL